MNKKICMIAYSLFPYDPRIRRESEALVRHGYDVTFLVLAENEKPRAYEMNGVNVTEMKTSKYRGKENISYFLSYLRFFILTLLTCSKLFLKHRVDILHVHNMPNFLVFAGILPRVFGKKVILDIHDSMPETYAGKFGNLSRALFKLLCLEESVCCAFADKVICVNDVQRNELIKRGIPINKIRVILNVPDDTIFKFDPQRVNLLNDNGDKFNLVYHGTVDEMLGIGLAIEAVSRVIDQIPGVQFYVYGTGRDLNQFGDLSIKLGIKDRIHFSRKNFPVQMLPSLLGEMDVGIIPNRKNIATDLMLPVKMLEYVAMGIPVVAAKLRTIEHYFSNEMVCYFEPESVESMTAAILTIYRDKKRRSEQILKAREFIDKYGWEKHQMDLIRLYEEL